MVAWQRLKSSPCPPQPASPPAYETCWMAARVACVRSQAPRGRGCAQLGRSQWRSAVMATAWPGRDAVDLSAVGEQQ